MKWPPILHAVGGVLVLVAGSMLPCLVLAWFEGRLPAVGSRTLVAFVSSIALGAALGGALLRSTRQSLDDSFTAAEGFAVAAFGWLSATVLGALPLWLAANPATLVGADARLVGASPGPAFTFVDGLFEAMSGFTTTGSSVFGTAPGGPGGLGLIEALPPSLLLWRALTHWLGGMGIIVLCLAVLPTLRVGAFRMFSAEVPGPTRERLLPRIRETAAVLWGVYVLMTVLQAGLLWAGEMPALDSVCHAFATMATGGFSTKDASLGHYAQTGHPSALYFEVVCSSFMFLAGVNFVLHFQALRGDWRTYFRDGECCFYALVVAAATLVVAGSLRWSGEAAYAGFAHCLRDAWFQVVAIITTTGFCSADFDRWPGLARAVLFFAMFLGGCAGSTAGGLKQVRILVVLRAVHRNLVRLLRPGLANRIRVGDATVAEEVVSGILGLAVLWGLVFLGASVLTVAALDGRVGPGASAAADTQFVTATTAVAATLNNVGPGLSGVGPTCNFGWMNPAAKLLLAFCMLLGRLELYTVAVLFLPLTWRR